VIAAPILHTEARIIARHAAFAGFSIPLEANDTIPACSSPLRAVGADAAQLALCLGAASAAVSLPFHEVLCDD